MFFEFLKRKDVSKVQPTRILVCTVGDGGQFEQDALSDASIYKRYYPNVIFKNVLDGKALIDLINSKEFDVAHILADVSLQGMIGDLKVNEILDSCMKNDIRIVFWASGACLSMKYFKGVPFHLIVTLDRKGAIFGAFLDGILSQLSVGKSLPLAWINIVPPNPKSSANNLQPSCVFSTGCGQMKFLP